MDFKRIFSGLAFACLSLLGACGGGGGTDSPPPNVLPPVGGVILSLVPVAGAPGELLYADAAPLRVLRNGATWTYRGTDQPRGAAASDSITYANKVSFAADAQGLVEQSTNLFNEGSDFTGGMRFEGGAYVYSALVDMMTGSPAQAATLAELRSPVRVNDLYGEFERVNIDTGTDFDGDRVNETAQVAVYSRVVAKETLDLPNRRGVEAVRVDMTMRMRLTSSKTHEQTPVYEVVQSTWYAPGIGVVKRRLDEPNSIQGLPNRIVTEVLENWDGLTEGLGYAPTRTAAAPPSSPVAGSTLQYPFDAVGFETHAVVAGYLPGRPSSLGIMLAQVDASGGMLAARSYDMGELFPGAAWVNEPRLVRSGNELRLFARLGDGSVGMAALDAGGQRILRPPVTMLATGHAMNGSSYAVAADGAAFWIAGLRVTPDADVGRRSSLLAVRVDGNGQALAQPLVVRDAVAGDIHDFSMAIDAGRVAFSWYEGSLESASRRLATIDSASLAISNRVLDMPPDPYMRTRILGLKQGLAVTCWGNTLPVCAARLDANGQPVLANGATLAGEAIKAPWLTRVNGDALGSGAAGELYVVASQYAPYWPGETDSGFTAVFRTNSAGGPLAAREPVLLARMKDWPGSVFATLEFGNRLLLLASDREGSLKTTVVWLPK